MSNQPAPTPARPSRDDIVAAAYRLLADRGCQATTVEEIARAAGVAPGLVHDYFAGKEELLLEVAAACSFRSRAELDERLAAAPPAAIGAAAVDAVRDRVTADPDRFKVRLELCLLGLRNPAFGPAVRELLASTRADVGRAAGGLGGTVADPAAVGAVLLACFDGLALQRLADPDLDPAYRPLYRMPVGIVGNPSATAVFFGLRWSADQRRPRWPCFPASSPPR